jgi:hypothetical protein
MPTIHKNLVFDHVYAATNDEEFFELKEIFLRFECATNQVVQADDDTWEGLYIQTRGQHYLEFLRDRRVNGMGLCMKAYGVLTQNAKDIVHDFPHLPWQTFERSLAGQKWFTALSCDNYLDLQTPFNTWVMHYHQRDSQKTFPIRKIEIAKIVEVEFSANPDLVEKVKLNSAWFNSTTQISAQEAVFDFQTYYSDPLRLKINFDRHDIGFNFKKVTLKMIEGFKPANLDLNYFKFYRNGENYILEKK